MKIEDPTIDGWLLYDFRGSNPIARDLLGLEGHLTRRMFYWIPREGRPIKLIHRIEAPQYSSLEGEERLYASRQELEEKLRGLFVGAKRIAMETGPIPYISHVDGGTLDLVRSCGVEVVSSGPLIEHNRAPLTPKQMESHRTAADLLVACLQRAFLFISDHMVASAPITELDVQEFLMCEFAAYSLVTDHPPICAAGPHSADPHHTPSDTPIKEGDLVLIDLWAKADEPDAVFADLTQVVVAGEATPRHEEIFGIVACARDAALALVEPGVEGWKLDEACRSVIEEAGYGEFFTHRTGHNISTELHGPGTHLDNFETQDTRPLLPGICFSVEPGIYLPGEFGIRLECDVLLADKVEVTGSPQKELLTIRASRPS